MVDNPPLARFTELFHRVRQGGLFPLAVLARLVDGVPDSSWVRCCGFNVQTDRLYLVPAHSSFAPLAGEETVSVTIGSPESESALHLSGELSLLQAEPLAQRLQERLAPLARRLGWAECPLWCLEVRGVRTDRFCWLAPEDLR